MASYNKVILMGNLTRDPELRQLPSNTPVTNFSIAVNERYKSSDGNWQERANFVDCESFGRTAENIAKFFAKGKPIFIEGRLRLDQWEDRQTGQKRSRLKVIAENFEFVEGRNAGGNRQPQQSQQDSQSTPSYPDHGPDQSSDDIPF